MPSQRDSFDPECPGRIADAGAFATLLVHAADDSRFHVAIQWPSDMTESCVRSDLLALESHMKACARGHGFLFRCQTIFQQLGRFLVSRIVCSTILVVMVVALVFALV